jgi:hypothetical protein
LLKPKTLEEMTLPYLKNHGNITMVYQPVKDEVWSQKAAI